MFTSLVTVQLILNSYSVLFYNIQLAAKKPPSLFICFDYSENHNTRSV